MITVHSLAYSRAVRIVWLLEELQVPYDVVRYERTEAYKAAPEIARIHPLGKSPVVEDGDVVLTESSAILRYLAARFGGERFLPSGSLANIAHHDEWLDYPESSLARWVTPFFFHRLRGQALPDGAREALTPHLDHLSATVAGGGYLTGDALRLADMQIMYQLAMLDFAGVLPDWPDAEAYWRRLRAAPALERAVEATGPIMPTV